MTAEPIDAGSLPSDEAGIALARRLAPVIRFSANEPFLPSHVGVTLLTGPGSSPSCPRQVEFGPDVAKVIEYAIWWDWDIQHLYELEHIWLSLDANDEIVGVSASAHGRSRPMTTAEGALPIFDGRVMLYSEPGKHAFHARLEALLEARPQLTASCAGHQGSVLVNDMFRQDFAGIGPADHRAVKRYLQQRAFVPSFSFSQHFDLATTTFLTWPQLKAYICKRVPAVLAEVRAEQPLIKAVLLDSGDTMVDEATEIRDDEGYVIKADLIPGVPEMLETLAADGYRLVLVADGRRKSFETVLSAHGIRPYLEAEIISEVIGYEKPDAHMFDAALTALGLSHADAGEIVMIGNHLARDIRGANRSGMISVWLNWSPRREKKPADLEEVPNYVARTPGELPLILEHIERDMAKRSHEAVLAATS